MLTTKDTFQSLLLIIKNTFSKYLYELHVKKSVHIEIRLILQKTKQILQNADFKLWIINHQTLRKCVFVKRYMKIQNSTENYGTRNYAQFFFIIISNVYFFINEFYDLIRR